MSQIFQKETCPMKPIATVILVCLCLLLVGGECSAQKVTVRCPSQAKLDRDGIAACQDTGCGTLDPLLNKQKNTTEGDPDTATDMTFAELASLPKLVKGYKGIGAPRKPLQDQGEGKMVRIVAWALDARPQKTTGKDKNGNPKKGESCNCGFTGVDDPENTDVHIVLVDDATLELTASDDKSTLKLREAQSQTAEYAPRVRLAREEEFDGGKLKKLIDPNHGGQLHVRVTGLLMYDSEHAVGPFKLLRHTDWEIHPVFRLEYCPDDKTCSADSDANWVDINN
jgi:hypothetical protein